MTLAKTALTIAAAAVTFGVFGDGVHDKDGPPLSQGDILVVQQDETKPSASTAPGTEEVTKDSAKMGKEEGTHAGHEGAMPENDTDKVEQPERRNETTGQ